MQQKRYGWIPDLPDARDLKYSVSRENLQNQPPLVDLQDKCPDIYNQGELGSCTANGIAGAIEFDLLKQGLDNFIPSRLFIYYNERVMEGTVDSDAGAMIRDGVKSVNKQGACDELGWNYDISKFTVKPDDKAYKDALNNVSLEYHRVPRDLKHMKAVLMSGIPFIVGFTVYTYFESEEMASKGFLHLPGQDETVLGGHCVLVVGYDDSKNAFKVRNSWGENWGLGGYFYMDYNYLLNENLSDDFWVINTVR
jgi:C1A family cysteine protease